MSAQARNDIPRIHQLQIFSICDSQNWRESLTRQQVRNLPRPTLCLLLRNHDNLHSSNRGSGPALHYISGLYLEVRISILNFISISNSILSLTKPPRLSFEMSKGPVHLIATLYPREGKVDRVSLLPLSVFISYYCNHIMLAEIYE
jgi:hypothetical protein